MNKSSDTAFYSLIFIFIASISTVGLVVQRHETMVLGLAYFAAFFAYFWIVRFHSDSKMLFGLGVFVRLLLFIQMPSLSDDVYRFIWDGQLLVDGYDPYALTPAGWSEIYGGSGALLEKLNSPHYFSVYPPLNQLIFWVAAKTGQDHWLLSTNIIRLMILVAEIVSFFLLSKLLESSGKDRTLAFWVFLNPLVILEMTGNLHFEAFVIFFLLLGLWLIQKSRFVWASAAFGGAIAMKLLPLIWLPALLCKFRWKNGIILSVGAVLCFLATFLPFLLIGDPSNIQNSLSLYFQKFEFNASIYFLVREVGFWITGYNTIATVAPILSIVALIGILSMIVFANKKNWQLEKLLLFTLLIYLSLATTVHPWYIIVLIPLGILSGYYFPVVWSFLIFVTYFGYMPEGFELKQGWVVFEYICLSVFIIYEFKKHKYHFSS